MSISSTTLRTVDDAAGEQPTSDELVVVGRRARQVHARDLVTGYGRYTTDIYLPNQIVGRMLYAGRPHARVVSMDVTRARTMPGVVAVITAEDVPGENTFLLYDDDQPLLIPVGGVVRYQGDALAIVGAVDEKSVAAALDAIEVVFDELPGVFDPVEALAPGAQQVWPDRSNLYYAHSAVRGDVDAGFEDSDVVIENVYQTQCMEQAFLEPEGAVAYLDRHGGIVVEAGCQAPHRDRRQIARSLGIPESRVRVITPYVGGAFGGKDETHVQIHAALLAQATGRPVRMIRTREESMLTHVKRHPIRVRHRLGAKADGRLMAIEVEAWVDGGPYANMTKQVAEVFLIHAGGPYYVPNSRIDAYSVLTNNPAGGAMRGFGMPQANFAAERQMDELARALSMDPLALRRLNAIETGARLATGVEAVAAQGMRESLEEAARLVEPRRDLPRAPEPHLRRGWGVAAMMQGYLLGPKVRDDAAYAGVELNTDGSAMLRIGIVDYGQGSHTVLAQVAAETLGIPLSAVRVIGPDTDKTLEAGSACASRVTFICGHAVERAARQVRDSLIATAAEMTAQPAESLRLAGGDLYCNGTRLDPCVADIATAARRAGRPVAGTAFYQAEYPSGIFDEEVFDNPCGYYTFGAEIAQVLVDIETGNVEVEDIWIVMDAGRILNPDGAIGQAEGGTAMGVGYALMEEYHVRDGRTLNHSLESYLIPTIRDVPTIHAVFLDSVDKFGPYGARSVSEAPVVPTAPAIANAIADATGARLNQIPMTAPRVLAALDSNDGEDQARPAVPTAAAPPRRP